MRARGLVGVVLVGLGCACDVRVEDAKAGGIAELAAPLMGGTEAPTALSLDRDERRALGAFVVDGGVRCTTALIEVGRDARFAVTARHCFEREASLEGFRYVSMDELGLEGDGVGVALKNAWSHPEVDLALVELSTSVAGARPFVFAEGGVDGLVGERLEVAGAGLGSGGEMRFGLFEVVDVDTARVEVHGEVGQCSGDSGGPWFRVEDGVGELVAVTSTSAPNCGNPAFGVRLDAVAGWVRALTEEVQVEWAPTVLVGVDKGGDPRGCAQGGAGQAAAIFVLVICSYLGVGRGRICSNGRATRHRW